MLSMTVQERVFAWALIQLPGACRQLEAKLQYSFRQPELLTEALTHCSSTDASTACNQRLEFVGDAILDYTTTRHFAAVHRCSPGGSAAIVPASIAMCLHKAPVLMHFHQSDCISSLQPYRSQQRPA